MRIAVVIAVVALTTIGALAYISGDRGDDNGSLAARLLIEDEYALGEPISLLLEVENTQRDTVTIVYGQDSPYSFGVNYPPEGDVLTGAWSFAPSVPTTTEALRELPTGERIQFRARWDQKDDSGKQVPPGVYQVWASHWGRCEPDDCTARESASIRITQ